MEQINFWHRATATPGMPEMNIVYITVNGKMGTIKAHKATEPNWERTWAFYVQKYNIFYWAYQQDIIPYEIMLEIASIYQADKKN